jgi:hypothetical protein
MVENVIRDPVFNQRAAMPQVEGIDEDASRFEARLG